MFTLYYSIRENASELRPVIDISRAIGKIRENAAEWGIIPNKIAVCGFSAGGYVAASSGTLWDHAKLQEATGGKGEQGRPDAMVLCYPVITAGEFAHRGSIERLGPGWSDAEREASFSLEKYVTASTPPAFCGIQWRTLPCRWKIPCCSLRRCGEPACLSNAISTKTADTGCRCAARR